MQRCLGYALTGLTTEQVFWILWGQGANGKSTLIELILHHVLGHLDYAWALPFPSAAWARSRRSSPTLRNIIVSTATSF